MGYVVEQVLSTTKLAAEIADAWDKHNETAVPKKRPDQTALAMQQLNSAMLALKAIADDNERKANETAVVDMSMAQADAILAEKIGDMLFESDSGLSQKLEKFVLQIVQDKRVDALANLGNTINNNAVKITQR